MNEIKPLLPTVLIDTPNVPAVAAPPAPLVVRKSIGFADVRRGFELTDFDGLRADHGGNRGWAMFNNGVNAMASAASCIPVVSLFGGGVNIAWGVCKIVGAGFQAMDHGATNGVKGSCISGMKSIVLGASVFLLPGVGEILNLVSAVKDGADAATASISAPTVRRD